MCKLINFNLYVVVKVWKFESLVYILLFSLGICGKVFIDIDLVLVIRIDGWLKIVRKFKFGIWIDDNVVKKVM